MRGFWNDPEGISITDFLALSFSGVYVVLVGLTTTKLMQGTLTLVDVQFLQVVTWPSLTILGGYFGGQVLNYLRNRPPNQGVPPPGNWPSNVLDPRLSMPLPDLGMQPVMTREDIEEAESNGSG